MGRFVRPRRQYKAAYGAARGMIEMGMGDMKVKTKIAQRERACW